MADTICDLCWKRASTVSLSNSTLVCKGCSYDLDRLVNYLHAHGWTIERGLQIRGEDVERATGEILDEDLARALNPSAEAANSELGGGNAPDGNTPQTPLKRSKHGP